MNHSRTPFNRLLAAALAAAPLLASAAAGQFAFVTGEVTLIKGNGQRVTPVRGTPVDPGDRISTGAQGMAQLTMVDNARLSLRPSTQFQIESYPDRRDGGEGAVLSLIRGTLRTFTGLLVSSNRDKFVMKTRVATVGIRGSGNILYACEGQDCDESVGPDAAQAPGGATINHTIEGSHSVTNIVAGVAPGLPAQQGGATTVITGPGQTVLVAGIQPPRYIPTPRFITETATNPAAKASTGTTSTATGAAEERNFSPSDTSALPSAVTMQTAVVGNNGLGFASDLDALNNASDPVQLQDIVISGGAPFLGQAPGAQVTRVSGGLRGYTAYAGSQSGLGPAIVGGTARDQRTLTVGSIPISLGRYEDAGLGFFSAGSVIPVPGSVHWIVAASGYPTYLSDVLTGTATYTLAAATSPTNQFNTAGTLTSATMSVNFSQRTMGLDARLSIPAAGSNDGGSWHLAATSMPFSINQFFASTSDFLTIDNSGGTSSRTNARITGNIEGSFVGIGLGGAIMGYGISDRSSNLTSNWNTVSGVVAFQGARLDPGVPYVEGRVSDPNGTLGSFILTYSTTDRPDEVTLDAQSRATAFSAPYEPFGPHATYSIGTAQVVQSGFDAETGLTWGRWSGGTATVSRGAQSAAIPLQGSSLHYIFAGQQASPPVLPLTGSATYDVIGSTSPTDNAGHVGSLGEATMNVSFTNRTVNANVAIAIANQTWNGRANDMPIYREQYFSASAGTPIPGLPNPSPLIISCTPNCGAGATGSLDGFFAGRNGQRAGIMYNLGGNQGAIAFGRRGG